jgi:hypothetical protein
MDRNRLFRSFDIKNFVRNCLRTIPTFEEASPGLQKKIEENLVPKNTLYFSRVPKTEPNKKLRFRHQR